MGLFSSFHGKAPNHHVSTKSGAPPLFKKLIANIGKRKNILAFDQQKVFPLRSTAGGAHLVNLARANPLLSLHEKQPHPRLRLWTPCGFW